MHAAQYGVLLVFFIQIFWVIADEETRIHDFEQKYSTKTGKMDVKIEWKMYFCVFQLIKRIFKSVECKGKVSHFRCLLYNPEEKPWILHTCIYSVHINIYRDEKINILFQRTKLKDRLSFLILDTDIMNFNVKYFALEFTASKSVVYSIYPNNVLIKMIFHCNKLFSLILPLRNVYLLGKLNRRWWSNTQTYKMKFHSKIF